MPCPRTWRRAGEASSGPRERYDLPPRDRGTLLPTHANVRPSWPARRAPHYYDSNIINTHVPCWAAGPRLLRARLPKLPGRLGGPRRAGSRRRSCPGPSSQTKQAQQKKQKAPPRQWGSAIAGPGHNGGTPPGIIGENTPGEGGRGRGSDGGGGGRAGGAGAWRGRGPGRQHRGLGRARPGRRGRGAGGHGHRRPPPARPGRLQPRLVLLHRLPLRLRGAHAHVPRRCGGPRAGLGWAGSARGGACSGAECFRAGAGFAVATLCLSILLVLLRCCMDRQRRTAQGELGPSPGHVELPGGWGGRLCRRSV